MTSSARAATLVAEMARRGVTHVIGLPDNGSAALFDALGEHATIALLTVTREGEAFAIASGVWMGGGRPVVVIQNTGLLESGDALRGTAMRMGVPLPCFIGYRGYAGLEGSEIDRRASSLDIETLTRADVDSTALLTERTLDAWGVPFRTYAGDDELDRVAEAFALAESSERPVALLLTRHLT